MSDRPIGDGELQIHMGQWGWVGVFILPPLGILILTHIIIHFSKKNNSSALPGAGKNPIIPTNNQDNAGVTPVLTGDGGPMEEKGGGDLQSKLGGVFGGDFGKFAIFSPFLALLPLGMLIFGGVAIALGFSSPRGREEWRNHKKTRGAALAVIFASIILAASFPTPLPTGPEEWGEPLAKENPDASIWPAAEVYLWAVQNPELMVITHTTTRIPGVAHSFFAEELVEKAIEITGADDERLAMAVERMSQETLLSGAFDPKRFELVEIASEGEHNYKSERKGIDETLLIKRQYVTYDSLIPGNEVLNVLTIHRAEMGGVVHTLTIVKLAISVGDIWAESLVLEWIEHLESK